MQNAQKALYIRVSQDIYDLLQELKQTQDESMGTIISKAILYFSNAKGVNKPLKGKALLNRMKQLVAKTRGKNISNNIDKIVYGK